MIKKANKLAKQKAETAKTKEYTIWAAAAIAAGGGKTSEEEKDKKLDDDKKELKANDAGTKAASANNTARATGCVVDDKNGAGGVSVDTGCNCLATNSCTTAGQIDPAISNMGFGRGNRLSEAVATTIDDSNLIRQKRKKKKMMAHSMIIKVKTPKTEIRCGWADLV